jgi:hypothetical protein
MELGKKEVLEIFKRNSSYEFVETPLGTAIKMPSREAFIFSAVTGAGYLDSVVLPFTPHGLLKLFYNVFSYNFVTGIFQDLSLRNTPYVLSAAKPYLFDTTHKFIVPVEFLSEADLQRFLRANIGRLDNPTDYLILRIEKSKKGNGMENFMEYLAAEYFRQRGFIVENQIPLAHALGTPDFGGYAVSEVVESVNEFLGTGFHIIELAMIRIHTRKKSSIDKRESNQNFAVVGEAKTGTTKMTAQLLKYMNTGLFEYGFEIHPSKRKPAEKFFGLLSLDENFEVVFNPPSENYDLPKINYSKEDYRLWLKNYMKFYLLANLTNDEFDSYFQAKNNRKIGSEKDIVDFVCNLSVTEIIVNLKEVLNG